MGYVLLAPYNDSMHLGQGFNSFLQRPCIDGAVKLTQADLQTQAARAGSPSNVSQVVSYSSRLVEKISDVVRGMNISAASSIKLGTIQVSGNSLSVDEAKFAASDMNAVISVKVINQITSAIKNPPLLKGAMNGSAGEFTLSEGTASSTIEAAVQETESTVTVNWSGGGQIKNDDAEWTLASLISAASAFPGRVAACPHKTYAILTPYNRNRSFVEWAEQNNITVPDFSPVQQYTHDLLDSFMEFKSILGRIQAVLANPQAYLPSSFDNAVSVDVKALVLERQKIKKEMVKIGNIVDKLLATPNCNPSTLITEEVESPEIWAARLPVLVESTMVNNKLTALETADVISGFYNNDPTQDTAEPEIPASLGSKMNDSMKAVQDATKEKEKEIEKETPVVEICSASIKASLTQQERAFVDSEFNRRKYSQYRFGDLVGVPGGRFFVDTLFLEQAMVHVSWPDRIEILLQDLNDSRVYALRTTYQETQESHGKNMGETVDSTFIHLEEGEVVNEVTLGRRDTTGVAFIRLRTSKNRETRIGTLKDCVEVTKCVPYDGCTGLKGFWGGSGDLVDRLGPIWVENFQVPVPVGDCSIHILIKTPTSVAYAFIMDGGVDSGGYSASEAIKDTLKYVNQYLKSTYKMKKSIKFSLWVVTHWDEDHFLGMMDLLAKQLEPSKPSDWMTENFVKKPKLYCGRLENFKQQLNALGFEAAGGESVLGYDLLSGGQIFDKNGTPICESVWEEDRPRFCIVGANGRGLTVSKAQQKVTRNQSSILAVLFWPKEGRRCCFFTGGDGNPELERGIINNFLSKSDFIKLGDGLDLMKLDHHGSSQENIYGGDLRKVKAVRKLALSMMPIGLFKPKNILITPGNLHGHPTFDVVHCLFDLLGTTTGLAKDTGKPVGRVWTTRSPYWATKPLVTTKDLNPSHNQDLEDIHKKELQAYQDPTKKFLGTGMLMAVEAEGSGTRLKRAQGLKAWRKKILQQSAILDGHNPTDYRVDSKAKSELIELKEQKRHSAIQEEEEEAAASAQFDYDYISYDDVMNIRFAGVEMWNLICDQGIVPPAENPFFIIHFRWENAVFSTVKCLGMDGVERKGYRSEPIVPPRYSQRLADIKEAQKKEVLKLLKKKARELKMAEDSKVAHSKRNRLKSQGRDQDSGLGLSASESGCQYNVQDFEKQNTFTHISRLNDSAVRQSFTSTSLGGFDIRPLGNISFQANLFPGTSLSRNEDRIISLHGLTLQDFSSTLEADKGLQDSVMRNPFTFIKELEADYQLKYRFDGDDNDEDVVLKNIWEDADKEIDVTLEKLNNLQKEWQTAWEESQADIEKEETSKQKKKRIRAAVKLMEKIKKNAEKTVANLDPTLFTGNLNAASRAEIEKLLVMAITYRPPDVEEEKEPETGRGRKGHQDRSKKSQAMGKNGDTSKQMEIEKEKKVKKEDKSNLNKRESRNEFVEQESIRKKRYGTK
ncbi:uncharacterized protein FTJAE_4114 [Fusarium tjaetaba]|uniref:Jacalin-type lectin domain-containing protein n=1 Tax=Fusarium tjaetaba TaxID=1567544 RepID=A0A8H5VXR5_9HYPO|nr:uncharacterized protein FTJAE_4114 [Fusarium tjaetaba]KAF5641462.1 hypothetical protein FTJAE_4114 [Fusarium tjaetaba]